MGWRGASFFRCGAFYCIYRCTPRGSAVAVKVPVQYRGDFERGDPFHPTAASQRALKEFDVVMASSRRNVLRLVEAWPKYGVLAYEWGDGGF